MTSVVNWARAERGHRLPYQARLRRISETREDSGGGCAPHKRVVEAGAGPRVNGRRYRCAGHRTERHGRDLLRHLPPRGGRRHRGDGEPQPDELQRHEAGAREREAHQRRHRSAGYQRPRRRTSSRQWTRRRGEPA